MYCRNCGKEVAANAEVCMGCGVKPANGKQFCQNCGVETQAAQEVCIKCGVKLAGVSSGSSDHTIMCVLSYLGILCLIPLLTKKDDDFIQFHAKQGLALFIAWIALIIAGVILGLMPFIGFLISMALSLVHIGMTILSIFAIIKAVNGEKWQIPVVSNIAAKLNF